MNNTQATHLKRALAVASVSTMRQRHGAVIAQGPRVLAVGVNSMRTAPMNCTDPRSQAAWHAEVAVLRQLRGRDLHGATLYVARLNRNQVAAMSRPCVACQAVIEYAGVSKVIYTTNEGWGEL